MKNQLLLPHRYKVPGWIVFSVFTIAHSICNIIYPRTHDGVALEIPGFTWEYISKFDWANPNLTLVLVTSGMLIGLLMICFSKEQKEDEFISFIRLRSWQWSVLVSYSILFLANWLLYGLAFLSFMIYNVLLTPVIFIIKFHFSLFLLKRNEK